MMWAWGFYNKLDTEIGTHTHTIAVVIVVATDGIVSIMCLFVLQSMLNLIQWHYRKVGQFYDPMAYYNLSPNSID